MTISISDNLTVWHGVLEVECEGPEHGRLMIELAMKELPGSRLWRDLSVLAAFTDRVMHLTEIPHKGYSGETCVTQACPHDDPPEGVRVFRYFGGNFVTGPICEPGRFFDDMETWDIGHGVTFYVAGHNGGQHGLDQLYLEVMNDAVL